MNNKVSSLQICMFFVLIFCSLYLGISDIILLQLSKNDLLLSLIIGSFLGLIFLFMYIKINDTYQELNIFEKNKKLFKRFEKIINFFILIIYFLFFIISINSISSFIINKYLENTSYILITLLIVIICFITSLKGLEVLLRFSQICFFISLILMILIELSLLKYVEFQNILPITVNINNIFNGSIYYIFSSSFLIFLLLTIKKNDVFNKEKYNKLIIIFYIISSIILILVSFFVLSCFGYKMTSLFKYPEYVLLKKIGLSNSELHLENLLSFRWIFYILSLSNISFYGIKTYFNHKSNNIKKNNVIILFLALIGILISYKLYNSNNILIIILKKYYILFFIFPVLLFFIIFLKCILKKDN